MTSRRRKVSLKNGEINLFFSVIHEINFNITREAICVYDSMERLLFLRCDESRLEFFQRREKARSHANELKLKSKKQMDAYREVTLAYYYILDAKLSYKLESLE